MADPIVEIKGLCKSFGEIKVLDQIDLEIEKGEIFGIIGMSGAGKSTLVRCINFLEQPTAGTVRFDGHDLSGLPQRELYRMRQAMGMIFQQFNLLMQRTALDNVCFPLEIAGVSKKQARARAGELLELVEMGEKAGSYPSQLSGGQRQRVAIARALATEPKVLLCDEATSALDPATTRGVLALLRDINRRLGITIIVITHEMRVVEEICRRVAILDSSKVVEMGPVEEIFTRPKSAAAQRLVYPDGKRIERIATQIGKRCVRIVFEGNSSFDPVIAGMVLEFGQMVNIMFADTKDIDGKAFGQIVIQLPEDAATAAGMTEWLRQKDGIAVEEVDDLV